MPLNVYGPCVPSVNYLFCLLLVFSIELLFPIPVCRRSSVLIQDLNPLSVVDDLNISSSIMLFFFPTNFFVVKYII